MSLSIYHKIHFTQTMNYDNRLNSATLCNQLLQGSRFKSLSEEPPPWEQCTP